MHCSAGPVQGKGSMLYACYFRSERYFEALKAHSDVVNVTSCISGHRIGWLYCIYIYIYSCRFCIAAVVNSIDIDMHV